MATATLNLDALQNEEHWLQAEIESTRDMQRFVITCKTGEYARGYSEAVRDLLEELEIRLGKVQEEIKRVSPSA